MAIRSNALNEEIVTLLETLKQALDKISASTNEIDLSIYGEQYYNAQEEYKALVGEYYW